MQVLTEKERRKLKEISQRCYDLSTEIADWIEEIDAMMQINPQSDAVRVKLRLKRLLEHLDEIGVALLAVDEMVDSVFEAEKRVRGVKITGVKAKK